MVFTATLAKAIEVLAVLLLDIRHLLIEFAEMFRGPIDSTSVYPHEVVKDALALVEVSKLDLVIVAGMDTVSFAEQGLPLI
ncbi:hypothetical protein JHL22_10920 [Advenella sp. WQ 585]|uniref:RadC-like JAB domain-containing protein n=1 Tax=Advenella mandrilli TaxID=2800330 RepID=A0ABS1EET8_9BURK|nr:hypothetical protein [Advenella mandrilli]